MLILCVQGCNSLLISGGGGRARHGHLSVIMSGAGDKYLDLVCNIFIYTALVSLQIIFNVMNNSAK